MSAILNSAILDSAILNKKKLHSFILTQLDDGSNLEFYHLGFSHFAQEKTSLIHCDPTWWWQPSWTLPCWIQPLPSWIQTPCYLLSRFTQKHSHSTLTLTQTNSILIQTHSFSLNLMMAAILNSAMLNFAILDSAFLYFLSNSLTLAIGFTPFAQKSFKHSFWLNLMMAAILNSAILDSAFLDWDTLLSFWDSLKKLSLILTLTQTNSIWLIWWWQPSWILLPWIQPFCTKLWLKLIQSDSTSFILTQLDDVSHLEFCLLLVSNFEQKKTSLIHSDSTWWW